MTSHPGAASGADPDASGTGFQGRFEFRAATGTQPPTVRAVGDIDLVNVGQFQAALAEAAAASHAITVDMTQTTYCDSAAIRALFAAAAQTRLIIEVTATGPVTTLFIVSGLDQAATVVTQG